ncbi:hypothetical protein EXIGLDRAFT_837100 [Exidia glandulosa HHB12029]|uniref:Uncharacterized protein n=1 Tax=Exidia glandulosa HHB12029 TaxID=1314781 RepID=A0A165H4G4_EXIGL|nr:hypothetical protein EXIGLDRAFT_837100 [Exidia glandulosa HHB12029]
MCDTDTANEICRSNLSRVHSCQFWKKSGRYSESADRVLSMATVRVQPTLEDWPVVATDLSEGYGQFVVVALDPELSVAALDDEAATRAAALIPRTRFLALVVGAGDIYRRNEEDDFRLSLTFLLVGQGLPLEYPEESIPIFPATAHPLNREPVRVTPPLPWNNLYVHTRQTFTALVSQLRIGPAPVPPQPEVEKDTIKQIIFWQYDDEIRRPLRGLKPRLVTEIPRRPPPTTIDSRAESVLTIQSSHHASDLDMDSLTRDYLVVMNKAALVEKCADIWLDLMAFPDPTAFGYPPDLRSILTQLYSIWDNWQEQSLVELAARPVQTMARAWRDDVATAMVQENHPEDGVGHESRPETGNAVARDAVPTTTGDKEAAPPLNTSGSALPGTSKLRRSTLQIGRDATRSAIGRVKGFFLRKLRLIR